MKRTLILAVLSSFALSVTAAALAVNAPGATTAVSSRGAVLAWGQDNTGQTDIPPGLSNNVVAIAGGFAHSLALSADGTVTAWGANDYGQGVVPTNVNHIVAISTIGWHNLALRPDGTVVAWGMNNTGQTDVPADLTNVVAIAAGQNHSLALKSDGTVVAWGSGRYNQTNVPPGLNNVVAIAAGNAHNVALLRNGTVVAWGYQGSGIIVPDGLSNVVAVAAGGYHSLALKSDGTVAAWGADSFGQSTVPTNLTNVAAIAGGGMFSLAIRADGSVVAFGNNDYGQTNIPSNLTHAVAIAGGMNHALAIQALAPTIAVQPQDLTLPARTNATFSVVASGATPMSFQWKRNGVNLQDGPRVTGSATDSLTLKNLALTDSARFSVVVSNAFGAVTSSVATLTVVTADLTRPRVAITSFVPDTGSNMTVKITGTTWDNKVVNAVRVTVNNGSSTNAATTNQFANWSISMPLVFGTNLFSVQAVDSSGNTSVPVTRSIFVAMTSQLTVTISGNGRVAPAWTTTNLIVGKGYKLTAIPLSGNTVFQAWTGDVLSFSPELNFIMQTNMMLTANFVPNPFNAIKGTFLGIFGGTETNQIDVANAGMLSLTTTTNGSFSGRLTMLSGGYTVAGKLQLDPANTNIAVAAFNVKRSRLPDVNAAITFGLVTNSDQITGVITQVVVTNGATVTNTAQFVGLLVQPVTSNPDRGLYNFNLTPVLTATNEPFGGSFGVAIVGASPALKLGLNMADQNAAAIVGTSETQDGLIPFFAPLYASKGAVLGWLQITNRTIFATNITWIKPAGVSKTFYPGGFSQILNGSGLIYTPTNRANVVKSTQGTILLDDGASIAITSGFTVTSGVSFIPRAQNTNSIQFSFAPANGALSGSFIPTNARRALGFKGVLIRDQSNTVERATGFFLETTQSGEVLINLGQPVPVTSTN